MKIIFMGTPDFSVRVLEALVESKHDVVAVVTQPDRPGMRGGKLIAPPVKVYAQDRGLRVLQYEKVSAEGLSDLSALNADVMITAAFGQILSQKILDMTPLGVLNVHASLLPKYRGSSPIQWAIINGEKQTGITIMKTALAVDSGDVLYQVATDIGRNETAGELFDRLSVLGAEAILHALSLIESKEAEFTAQDEKLVTHCAMLKKSDGKIDFSQTAQAVHDKIRGVTPWPGAFASQDGEVYKLFDSRVVPGSGRPGEILAADAERGLVVACSDGAVSLCVQKAGGKKMPIRDFLRGHSFRTGSFFE